MHHDRISIGVAIFIIANAVLSAIGNPDIDNLEVPALDSPTNLGSNFIGALNSGAPDEKTLNTFAPDDFAPNEEKLGSFGTLSFPNSDISGVTKGLRTISDSGNCAENLGKREDSGLTIISDGFCGTKKETPTSEPIVPPPALQDLPKLPSKIWGGLSDWWSKQRESLPFFGKSLPTQPRCEDFENKFLCCGIEIPSDNGRGINTQYCGIWGSWNCYQYPWYCCVQSVPVVYYQDNPKTAMPRLYHTLAGRDCRKVREKAGAGLTQQ